MGMMALHWGSTHVVVLVKMQVCTIRWGGAVRRREVEKGEETQRWRRRSASVLRGTR